MGELASPARFELATYRFVPLQFSLPDLFGSVRGLDFIFTRRPSARRCCPSSLYTFPLQAGLARYCHHRECWGFTEFEQIHTACFQYLVPSYLGGDCSIQLSYGDAVASIPSRVSQIKTPFSSDSTHR